MARIHSLPSFPSLCTIWRGGLPGVGVAVYSGKCQKRVTPAGVSWDTGAPLFDSTAPGVTIYFPAGTDVRGQQEPGGPDYISWAGSNNYVYQVQLVEDIAEGFANRFRVAWVVQIRFIVPRP
jgi:hypothetical protein